MLTLKLPLLSFILHLIKQEYFFLGHLVLCVYIYIYFLSKTVCDPTTQQVPVATGPGFNTFEQILSVTTVPVEPPPKIQEHIHQRVQVFV